MKPRISDVLGVLTVLALAVAGCAKDPLSDLDGAAAVIVTNFSLLNVPVNDTATFTAAALDGRALPVVTTLTFTSRSTATARVENDPSYTVTPTGTSARARVIGVASGTTYAIVEGSGVRDSVRIIVP